MEEIILNETPVRTSRNFNINNIKLKNFAIPSITKFNNVKINNVYQNVSITEDEKLNDMNIFYGVGTDLTNITPNKTFNVEVNEKKENEIRLEFNFDRKNLNLVDNILITANENSISTIILKYETKEDLECFHSLVLKTTVNKNSTLNVIIINYMNILSKNFLSIQNEVYDNGTVNYMVVDFGGSVSVTNYFSDLVGRGSENNINTIYLGSDLQLFDLNYIGELRGEKSNINIEVQGALKDSSKKHFKGTIDFKKGAKKSKGNENEACMLLSDTAKSISLPMLLCSEEDVEGNHSSSAGKIGDKELFYIKSRGFNEKDAIKLMVRAKFNSIIENIKNEELKKEILEKIDKKLD